MGATGDRRVARPRIRQRLRVIAVGLVLLPSLAIAVLVKAVADADAQAKVRELQQRRDRVQGRAEDLADGLSGRSGLFPAELREHYTLREAVELQELSQSIDVDGFCADWRVAGLFDSEPCQNALVPYDRAPLLAEHVESYDPSAFSFSLMTGTRESYLYVFLRVLDDDHTFRRRDLDGGDQLRLAVSVPRDRGVSVPARFAVTLEPGPDGALTTYQVGRSWSREVPAQERMAWGDYQLPAYRRPYGIWRPTARGYDLELRLPLRTLGERWREADLGLAVVDVDRGSGADGLHRQAMWVVPQREGAFALEAPGSETFQRAWSDLELNLRQRKVAIFDARRRELFSSFFLPEPLRDELREETAVLLAGLARGDARSRSHDEGALAAARVVSDRGRTLGFVLEQDPTPVARPRLAAIARDSPVTAAILGGALLLLFLLLGYTSRLSRRILTLVDDVGAERDADDEIGELSRRISDLVERVKAHRDYLERLPAILGHETLGPLGVMRMFIDDLAQRDLPDRDARLPAARRALRSIEELIEDLREATSLEEALAQGERTCVDLIDFLHQYASARAATSQVALEVDLPEGPFPIVVIENRIEQLLDKLLDNAEEFSSGAPIRMALECDGAEARIQVENTGSQLPTGPAADQMFEPMWSQRKRTSERHLGMGLYVAHVVAGHHGGSIRAWNADENRVVFEATIRGAGD